MSFHAAKELPDYGNLPEQIRDLVAAWNDAGERSEESRRRIGSALRLIALANQAVGPLDGGSIVQVDAKFLGDLQQAVVDVVSLENSENRATVGAVHGIVPKVGLVDQNFLNFKAGSLASWAVRGGHKLALSLAGLLFGFKLLSLAWDSAAQRLGGSCVCRFLSRLTSPDAAKVLPGDVPGGDHFAASSVAMGRPVLLSPGGLFAFYLDESEEPLPGPEPVLRGGGGGPGDGLGLFGIVLLILLAIALFSGCAVRF